MFSSLQGMVAVVEVGVLIAKGHRVLHWHLPVNRTSVTIPDSRDLWSVIWENRNEVLGFAHSHPGSGMPGPSWEDLTTFAAIEAALGTGLVWWICSRNALIELRHNGSNNPHDYLRYELHSEVSYEPWLPRLRVLSYGEKCQNCDGTGCYADEEDLDLPSSALVCASCDGDGKVLR